MEQQDLFLFDRQFSGVVCGLDEAGRGPLAGPVFAGCVCLREGARLPFLNDSKKLTEKRRETLFALLTDGETAWYGIGEASAEEIDRLNILRATFLAMNRAYDQMAARIRAEGMPLPEYALVDGNRDPLLPLPSRLIVKGDAKSASIAAASVLAKVSRDRRMLELAERYPQYGFEQHKGYPTRLHYEKIAAHGISPIHRRSFLKTLNAHIGAAEPPLPDQARRTGAFGEKYTEAYLTRAGYKIRAANWRCAQGEIDLIAEKDGVIAFVEVKTRSEHTAFQPAGAVDAAKRGRIIRAARRWLEENRCALQPRFDVAEVFIRRCKGVIEAADMMYIPSAFDSEGEV